MKGKIDFKRKVLILEYKKEKIEIPIFVVKKESDDKENESEDEIYEKNEEQEIYTLSESESESENGSEIEYEELKDEYLGWSTQRDIKDANPLSNKEMNDENLSDNMYEIKSLKENDEKKEFEESLKIGKIDNEKKTIVKELIEEYKEICALSNSKLGQTNIIKHRINLESHEPIASKPYNVTIEKKKIIKDEIEKMEKAGVIRKSYSPWASPVVIVGKKDG